MYQVDAHKPNLQEMINHNENHQHYKCAKGTYSLMHSA